MGVGCSQPSACMARSVSGRRVRSPNLAGASDVAVKIEIASLCSGQLTGCGYCRVSWCRHLRVSRRIQLATRRPATHNARDAALASLAERIMTTIIGYHVWTGKSNYLTTAALG